MLAAALKEFSEKSFEDASLNSIIKNSGISKGTFYYHFKNKEDIYFFLIRKGYEEKWRFIQNHVESNPPAFQNADIFDKFLFQAKMGVLFAQTYPEFHKLSKRLLKEKNTLLYEKAVGTLNGDSEKILSGMINEAYEKGEFAEGYSKEFITKTLSHLFTAFDDIFERGEGTDKVLLDLKEYILFMKYGLKSKK